MAKAKTATLSFRIKPALKDALRAAAERDHRSIANMVEVMVLDYCGRNRIPIAEPRERLRDSGKPNGIQTRGKLGGTS